MVASSSSCTGCNLLINEGSVIAFGTSYFHHKCFICTKCSQAVDCESNLLLLSNGKPVCENCSYSCNVCKLVIKDEAIMTGDDAYHAECFRCASCNKKIEDLVFTQTSKGIHCTPCHEKRKAEKQKRRQERDKKKKSSSPPTPPSSHSRSNSNENIFDMPSFSFFENESTELSNLTKQLGANITMKDTAAASTTTEKINRASHYLESSLIDFPNPPSKIDQLSSDLEASETKLKMMQHNYQKIQEASRNALDELTRAKEEFAKEVALRQQHELTIAQLRHQLVIYFQAKKYDRDHLAVLTKEEIERVSKVRAGLDKTCCDLKSYRDNLLKEIDSLLPKPVEREEIVSLEVSSLVSERDQLRHDIRSLETIRDDVLNEMIMLNSKNAQLTEINNDLSRRMSEREKDFSPSPSLSSENISMQRKSSEASIARKTAASPEPKTGFKLKRTMFSKLSGKNKEASPVYGQLGNSSHLSLHPYEKTKRKPSQENQAHSFQPTSFLRPTKCDGCGETLWGLSELRCAHCLCASHARCLPQIATHCYMMSMSSIDLGPSEMDLSAVLFGLDLCTRAQLEQRPVPLIIARCIEAVEKRGMSYEGIYRKSGGATQMKLIQTSFESGSEPIDLEDYELINDICSVTSILKQYFRELPNPLLTYQLYSKFIDAVSMNHEQERIDKFYELLSQLPKVNYDTLELLMKHLHSVQEHSSENLMTTKNLAMVFGPTLMRDEDGSRELTDMSYKNAVIEFLITRVHQLFT